MVRRVFSPLDRPRTTLLRTWSLLASVLAVGLVAGSAHAAPNVAGADGKRFRLHGDTELLSYFHFNPDGSGPDNINGGGFGIGRSSLMDSGAIGGLHPRPVWSVGFGYVFLGHRAIVGGKFAFALDGFADEDSGMFDDEDSTTLVSGLFVPYFRWMFMPGNWARPYVGINFGFGGGALRVDDRDTGASILTQQIWPVVGVDGGVHLFIIDAFSVDLGLGFEYFAPHARAELVDENGDVVNAQDDDWDKAGDVINLAGELGISVWFG